MTAMANVRSWIESSTIAGGFERSSLCDDQSRKLKESGAEIDIYSAYDGRKATQVMIATHENSTVTQVRVPITAAVHDGAISPKAMLAATQLATFVPGANTVIDQQGRVNLSFLRVHANTNAREIQEVIERDIGIAANVADAVRPDLERLGLPTDLSRDNLLAREAGKPYKLTAKELEALSGGNRTLAYAAMWVGAGILTGVAGVGSGGALLLVGAIGEAATVVGAGAD